VLLDPHEPLVSCLDVVAEPDSSHTAGADVHVPEARLIRRALGPLCRVLQRVVEDSLLDVGCDAIRMRIPRALLLDECGDAADLKARFTS
jgi:hypothetical protein